MVITMHKTKDINYCIPTTITDPAKTQNVFFPERSNIDTVYSTSPAIISHFDIYRVFIYLYKHLYIL